MTHRFLHHLYLVINQLLILSSFPQYGQESCYQPRRHSYQYQHWSHTRNTSHHFDQLHSTVIFPEEVGDPRSGNPSLTISRFAVSPAQFLEFGIS